MRATTLTYASGAWTRDDKVTDPNLVLWFGSPKLARDAKIYDDLRARFPKALIAGCSTGGEIYNDEVHDGTAVAAAIRFDHTTVRACKVAVSAGSDSAKAGREIAAQLSDFGLRAVYLLSDGLMVNGAKLVQGLLADLPPEVVITGGLAGDGADFASTCVGLDGPAVPGVIAAIGFYGGKLNATWGSAGGWDPFGPQRKITRSEANVLYELDGKPALELYKRYLGEAAEQLPGSALLFPLVIRPEAESSYDVVRTIVGVDEKAQSLIFAGDMPQGWTAQLMRGVPDSLIDGALRAARQARVGEDSGDGSSLALLVSCIGRKLMMGQRISDEVEIIRAECGAIPTIGFYSYGEICPHGFTGSCTLHNQTMTITVLREAA
ncbi:MAG TPA: FIST N-terminal domain-containing protein [Alphaproteobacteria bacterium]|nr:FIST N-terminal domain-containing protein [Alphaproteobacteria bacterium]